MVAQLSHLVLSLDAIFWGSAVCVFPWTWWHRSVTSAAQETETERSIEFKSCWSYRATSDHLKRINLLKIRIKKKKKEKGVSCACL